MFSSLAGRKYGGKAVNEAHKTDSSKSWAFRLPATVNERRAYAVAMHRYFSINTTYVFRKAIDEFLDLFLCLLWNPDKVSETFLHCEGYFTVSI